MAGSYDRYMFIFLRNCQTVLHRAKPFLFSYLSVRELLSSKRSSYPATSDSFSFLTFIKVCRNISLHFVFSFSQWLILFFFFLSIYQGGKLKQPYANFVCFQSLWSQSFTAWDPVPWKLSFHIFVQFLTCFYLRVNLILGIPFWSYEEVINFHLMRAI